tara:strand:- start:4243 stop:5058 length:816 start_codon:yes stop_codon:yes gene_type:complete
MQNSKNFLMEMIQAEISSMGNGSNQGTSTPLVQRDDDDNEKKLRAIVREICQRILTNKTTPTNEQVEFRNIVRTLIQEAKKEVEDAPHDSTAINLLEELLKQILPGVETDFKVLTTSKEQRESFRANLLNAVSKLLAAEDVNNRANRDLEMEVPLEEIDVKIEDSEMDIEPEDMFIDIDDDGKIPEEEEEAFGIEGQEETGRNMAAKTYDNIEKNIIDTYAILSDEEDRQMFQNYLITNLKLYFDKYEAELDPGAVEPTTDTYETEKTNEL